EIAEDDGARRSGVEADQSGEGSVAGQAIEDLQLRRVTARSDQVVRNVGPVGRLVRGGVTDGDEFPETVAAIGKAFTDGADPECEPRLLERNAQAILFAKGARGKRCVGADDAAPHFGAGG